ncbi:hypothetical protein [Streptomyces antibioticus]|uniref:hypothetical protein n=1 Tax=Streptomyces antibioticus TaxID=1890 RepID=UPI0033FD1B00
MTKPHLKITGWLHRHGIARTLQSSTSTSHPNVRYLIEARWWTPRWLLLWAAHQNFRRTYSTRTATMYLDTVRPQPIAEDGTQRWVLLWRPTTR